MSKKGHVPIRMCVGCRAKKKKEEMVRFTRSPGGLLFSEGEKHLNGRGLYLCPDLRCLRLAKKKTIWARSLESMDQHYFLQMKGKA